MVEGKGLENFLRSATAASQGNVMGVGEGLAQMFGSQLPPGVNPKDMEAMWKFLDDMAEKDPEEYKKFIKEKMDEMKGEIDKEKEEAKKAQTIQSEPAFCIKALVAKKVDQKAKQDKKTAAEGIKLFDFNDSQIKESFVDNDQKGEPLEEPKLYLNIVHHKYVMQPVNKQGDLADPKNDRDWLIIPTIFTEPKERKSLDGRKCLTWDVHVNSCVVFKMKEEARCTRAISNYIIMKFQEHIEDQYIIHKKSIKNLKNKRYKDPKGTDSQKVAPFVLPMEHDVRHFEQMKEKLKKEAEEQKKQQGVAPQKQDIRLLPTTNDDQQKQASGKETNKPSEDKSEPDLKNLIIPGQTQQSKTSKPVVIQEIGKTIPNFEMKDESPTTFTMTFNVEEESSAKDIDLDISETMIKLNSQYYEFKYDFKQKHGFSVDPTSVKAKFNKGKKTLALTLTKLT